MKKKLMLLIAALLTIFFGKVTAYPTSIAQSEEDPPFFSDEYYAVNSTPNIEATDVNTVNIELSNEVE